jgi:addiction module RelE/StbE family toxin
MAFRIIWTETAAQDFKGISEFIAIDNPDAARRLAKVIISKIENLSDLPLVGRMVPEKGDPDIREVVLSPYRIVYRVEQKQGVLFIARIWHSARGIPDL